MLDPQAAGVAFTRHPVTGARVTVVEAVRGLGEPLVSGQVSPPPAALTAPQRRAVARVAERVEALLGAKSRRPAALAPRVHHSAACRARRRSLVAGGRVSPSPMGQSQRARAGAGALAS